MQIQSNSVPMPSPTSDTSDGESLVEKTRHEAQEKIVALHIKQGTVEFEGEQNSPSPEDVTPQASHEVL